MAKKKVLFVITKSNFGGAQRYVYDCAVSLRDHYDVVVALGGTGTVGASPGLLVEKLHTAGIRTVLVPAFMRDISLFAEFRALQQLVAIYTSERPDIVHLNSSKAGGIGSLAAVMAHVPKIVFTIHGLPFEEQRSIVWRSMVWMITWVSCLLSTDIITVASPNYEKVRALPWCAKKVRLVHNGIGELSMLSRVDARALLSSQKEQSDVWVGCIAELTPNKNLFGLLNAVLLLKKQGYAFVLHILGDGEQLQVLKRFVQNTNLTDRVFFHGFIADAYKYVPAFDVWVLSSHKEGLPYVLLESGYAGIATAATNVGGIPDLIKDGQTGLLSPIGDTNKLAENLAQLIVSKDLRTELGGALHTWVMQEFSLSRMIERTRAIYDARS